VLQFQGMAGLSRQEDVAHVRTLVSLFMLIPSFAINLLLDMTFSLYA